MRFMSACSPRNNASGVLQVYRLHDACATLQLALLARQQQQHRVTDYVEENAADLVAASRTVLSVPSTSAPPSVPPSWVCIGVSSRSHRDVYLALPTYAAFFFDYSIEWALFASTEMSRQYVGRCMMAKLQTVGGGWASLHRADKALLCALQLYRVAVAVFDEEVVRKCRLFIGWAFLWNSNRTKALEVFQGELDDARARGDLVHERRCLHAVFNAELNPNLAPGGAYTDHFDLVDRCSNAFA
ncbi:hypothetical protein ABB37_02219 [Leptomonas pyrrhocoris]|uniref:Uncharacterized protein n=1 Tax=Leptomonas pyrrhocoris TaxID=157538 RepID=A0A0M9G7C2_LEPPY|nr:hypothetical protein ABB37_02219 [Leptomonas pyrrhocoris]KPA84140.1 hypothetical protein ABB37_02219 [Leptomonas pyrrhocoris]|eukprot:XP_015662579.1 hypothetical protein ABB37_02219 [Leptomonas pyrrhocoris]